MQRHGWTLLFHDCLVGQLSRLGAAAGAGKGSDPPNANEKLLRALRHAMLEVVPSDPGADAYRQGNTLGKQHRHWRRIKIGQRFRLFFRYDTRARIIVYAWVNDDATLRTRGARNDAYAVFQKMLDRGHPPHSWDALVQQARAWGLENRLVFRQLFSCPTFHLFLLRPPPALLRCIAI